MAVFDVEQVEQDQQAKPVEPQVAHELTRASGERANSQAAEAFYARTGTDGQWLRHHFLRPQGAGGDDAARATLSGPDGKTEVRDSVDEGTGKLASMSVASRVELRRADGEVVELVWQPAELGLGLQRPAQVMVGEAEIERKLFSAFGLDLSAARQRLRQTLGAAGDPLEQTWLYVRQGATKQRVAALAATLAADGTYRLRLEVDKQLMAAVADDEMVVRVETRAATPDGAGTSVSDESRTGGGAHGAPQGERDGRSARASQVEKRTEAPRGAKSQSAETNAPSPQDGGADEAVGQRLVPDDQSESLPQGSGGDTDPVMAIKSELEKSGAALAEGVSEFMRGLALGDFAESESLAAVAGQIVGGLIPVYGQLADVRDLVAALKQVAEGKEGAWASLGLAAVGFVPLFGDVVKAGTRVDGALELLRRAGVDEELRRLAESGGAAIGAKLAAERLGGSERLLATLNELGKGLQDGRLADTGRLRESVRKLASGYDAELEQRVAEEIAKSKRRGEKMDDEKLGEVRESVQKALLDEAYQRYSELERAAEVLRTKRLADGTKVTLGARSAEELKEAGLRALPAEVSEADLYYKTADGVVHVEEVKSTFRALNEQLEKVEKIAEGAGDNREELQRIMTQTQLGRYAKWAQEGATAGEVRAFKVYVPKESAHFDELLDLRYVDAVGQLESVSGRRLLQIGDREFSADDLQQMYDDAKELIDKWKEKNPQASKKELHMWIDERFGTLERAEQTLRRRYGVSSEPK